jgi:hypothetical protein
MLMRMRRHFHLNFQMIEWQYHSWFNIPVLYMTWRIITPLTKWGSVWGTSVTVPVTISTSYYYYYFPAMKFFFVFTLKAKCLSPSCRTCWEMITYHPAWLTFDPLRSYWPLDRKFCWHYSILTVNAMIIKLFQKYRPYLEALMGV